MKRKKLNLIFLAFTLLLSSCTAAGSSTQITSSPAPTAVPLQSQPQSASTPLATDALPQTGATTAPAQAAETASTFLPLVEDQATAQATAAPTQVVPPPSPISLPSGFAISVFAQGLSGPRMMAFGPDGQLYVADRGNDRIVRLPDRNGDGVADGVEAVATGLNSPDSLAFYQDGSLYVSTPTQIIRLSEPDANGDFQKSQVIVDGLPGGGHSTRTVVFSPDFSTMFVQIGSSCNVCNESDERRAAILSYNPDGSNGQVYAKGLRNAVGMTFRPGTTELWATDMGRDYLGDNQPPETIYQVQQGMDAGWPRCHAGRIVDPDFGSANACQGVAAPVVEMQAHSAPIGLAFYTGRQFPAEYQGSLFVAFHGSWNRSVPTGYKIVRIPMNGGQPSGAVQDFAAGWLVGGSAWGRPVDVVQAPDGSLFVSDDGAGIIYRIFYTGQ
jgi:glucose/arabinose dehydrogenase